MSTMTKSQKVVNYNILFPCEKIYKIIVDIDQELRKLYSFYHILTFYPVMACSPIRDDKKKFEYLLNKVEGKINKMTKKVIIEHNDDEAFRIQFPGISCFLDERKHRSKVKDTLGKKFYNLADRLYQLNIHPYDYI